MIFISSYPYVGERHRRVFDYFKNKDDLVFILPEEWKMKGGKVVMKTEPSEFLKIIPTKAYFFHSNYPIIKGQFKGWMPALKKILKDKSKRGDILYSVSEPNLLVTYLNAKIARDLGLKHVFFTWQNVDYKSRISGLKLKLTEWIIRKNISLSAGIICGNSKAENIIRPYLPPGFPILKAPVSGMDTEKFKPGSGLNFKDKYGLGNKIVVLFVGALDNRKGILKIADAFKKARLRNESLHLLVIGTGPLEQFFKKYLEEIGIDKNTTVLPWVDNNDLPGYFSNSDIFVYPSQRFGGWEEQFGYSIAEASSSALPVISTRTGSIEDIVINSVTGILIEPDSLNSLTESIIKLAENPELRRRMGMAGRKFIEDNFSHRIIADKMEKFLRNL